MSHITKEYVDTTFVTKLDPKMSGDLDIDGTDRNVSIIANNIGVGKCFEIGIDSDNTGIVFIKNGDTTTECAINANSFEYVTNDDIILRCYKEKIKIFKTLSMMNNKITNVKDPINIQDVATKNYVDNNFITKSYSTMSGDLDMGRYVVKNSGTPFFPNDLITKEYVDNIKLYEGYIPKLEINVFKMDLLLVLLVNIVL